MGKSNTNTWGNPKGSELFIVDEVEYSETVLGECGGSWEEQQK